MRQLIRNCELKYPDEVTTDMLLHWRAKTVNNSILPVTWNSYIRHLKVIFRFGIDSEMLLFTKNPFDKLFLRTGKPKRKVYSQSQLQDLSFGIKDEAALPSSLKPLWFIQTLVMTFRCTAMRCAQLNKLKIKDVDLPNRLIHISAEINKNHEHHTLPISSTLYPYLEHLISELKKRKQTGDSQLFNINLFSNTVYRKGKNMTTHQIGYIFKQISAYTGIASSPHRFRHTAATNLMRNPENLYITKQLLGHKDIKVTLSYIEDNVDTLREYADSL